MHQQYLGDGVYASHDGYQIWLAVGNHQNRVVALDPSVMEALILYNERINALKEQANNGQG
jgi:hypothetical protein